MPRPKNKEDGLRKIIKLGDSHAVTIPKDIMQDLKWRKKQRVFVEKKDNGIIIKNYK